MVVRHKYLNFMFKREIEDDIFANIESNKVLLLIGARQVWKTTILKKVRDFLLSENKEVFLLNLENPEFRGLLDNHPENIFQIVWKWEGKKYILIDEIQYLKDPTNFLKYIFDEYNTNIKLIVTWSSAFYIDKKFRDSLAGRKKIFYIYTLSFKEFLLFKGKEELINFIDKKNIPLLYKKEIFNYYEEYIIYWWYPEVVSTQKLDEKKEILAEMSNSYIKKDIYEAKIEYEEKYFFILKLLSSQIGNLLNVHELSNTVNLPVSTIENYIYIMRKSFHIAIVKPFFENIRKELTKMPKVYFFDLWLRNHFINNFETFSLRVDNWALLENVVFKKLLDNNNFDEIKFWRTQNKNEIDFILEKSKKAYEVKVNLEKFTASKYEIFTSNYPNYVLEPIDLEKSLLI